ncbi:MAG: acyl carrier protein [Bacteroidales bacterium]|jgi:acyl carrier protein|nr:acyl carrier protein [Bacteroidales bacterium]
MRQQIKDILSLTLRSEIADDCSQRNCHNWDSLNHLNIVIALEETFDISFEPEEIAEMTDIDTIEFFILKKRQA